MRMMLKYFLNNSTRCLKKTMLTVFMEILSLTLIAVIVFIYEKSTYVEKNMEAVLKQGIEGTGIIYIADMDNENCIDFIKQVRKTDGIKGCCAYSSGAVDYKCLRELAHIQYQHTQAEYPANAVEVTIIEPGLENVFSLSLQEGEWVTERDDNIIFIYLGSKYDNIPVGTKFTEQFSPDYTVTYQVMGILDEESRLLDMDATDVNLITTKGYLPLDYAVLAIDSGVNNDLLFAVDGRVTDDIREKIVGIADKYNVPVTVGNMENVVKERRAKNNMFYENMLPLLFIMLFVTITIQICVQLTMFYNDMNDYGILYAFGGKKNQIAISVFVDNFLKLLCANIVAVTISKRIINSIYSHRPDECEVVNKIMNTDVLIITFLFTIIIAVTTTAVSSAVMVRHSPVDMLSASE